MSSSVKFQTSRSVCAQIPSFDNGGQEMQLLQGGCEILSLSALKLSIVCEKGIQVLFLSFLRLYHESQGYSHS